MSVSLDFLEILGRRKKINITRWGLGRFDPPICDRSLMVTETGAIRKLECGFLFAFYSNYGRIYSRLRYSASKNGVRVRVR